MWADVSLHNKTNIVFINRNLTADSYQHEVLDTKVIPLLRNHRGMQLLINARFNGRLTHANLHAFAAIIGDILPSHDKNQIHVHNHAGVHTVSLIDCERVCDH